MKTKTLITQIAALALTASMTNGAVLRFTASGNWTKIQGTPTGDNTGWTSLPGTGDEARINFGNNTVTVNTTVPTTGAVLIGVDENGNIIVASGGSLATTGDLRVGNNNANVTNATLTVQNGGSLNVGGILWSSTNSAVGNFTIANGGSVSVGSHLWWGISQSSLISIGGTLTQTGGNLGLGTSNASTASGGTATVNIINGGILALNNISAATSIQAGSVINLSGSGQLTVPGDRTGTMNDYITANKITGNGMTGSTNLNVTFDGAKTIVTAVPEPSSTLLIGFTGLTLLSRRRRG